MLLNCDAGEDSWESLRLQEDPISPSKRRSVLAVHWKDWLKLKHQYSGHLIWRADSFEKTLMLGKIEGERRRERQDEMVGWHYRLKGHESEQAPGVVDGQGSLACCSPWGRKELNMTEWLNWNNHWFLKNRLVKIQASLQSTDFIQSMHDLHKLFVLVP